MILRLYRSWRRRRLLRRLGREHRDYLDEWSKGMTFWKPSIGPWVLGPDADKYIKAMAEQCLLRVTSDMDYEAELQERKALMVELIQLTPNQLD